MRRHPIHACDEPSREEICPGSLRQRHARSDAEQLAAGATVSTTMTHATAADNKTTAKKRVMTNPSLEIITHVGMQVQGPYFTFSAPPLTASPTPFTADRMVSLIVAPKALSSRVLGLNNRLSSLVPPGMISMERRTSPLDL